MKLYELCSCGHTGGFSPNGVHKSRLQQGHGSCKNCDCIQFTWVGWCNEQGKKLSHDSIKINSEDKTYVLRALGSIFHKQVQD